MIKSFSKILKIEKCGKGKVYDFTVANTHRILANNFYTSNCHIKHPNATDFMNAKLDDKKVTGANISLKIDDEFMNSVKFNKPYIQKFPIDSENPTVINEVDPQPIWNKIINNAWKSAEPGILFWDTIIRESVPDCYADLGYKTVSTNPCLPADTWIFTVNGARQIKDLIGIPFNSITNGNMDSSTSEGFFYTGNKEVFEIKTKKGYSIKGTDNHKIKTINDWVEIKNLKVGDSLILNDNKNVTWAGNGDYKIGYLFGNFIGYVNLSNKNFSDKQIIDIEYFKLKNHFDTYGINSDITINYNIFEKNSYEFYCGFISGLFDIYGNISNINDDFNISLSISNNELLYLIQRMLSRIGIISSVNENDTVLTISKNNLLIFKDAINFIDNDKKDKFETIISNIKEKLDIENFQDEIVSIRSIGFEDVYDCQILNSHQFDANGIIVHNCGELPLCPYDSCRLLAINLYSYVENPFTPNAFFNFDLFKKHVTIAQRFMDDMIDLEVEKIDLILNKIKSDPEPDEIKQSEILLWTKIRQKCIDGRRTGLGITAEGDMLAALNLKYGTKDATNFSVEVQKTLAISAYKSSVIMAKERGEFPIFDYNREINNPFINRLIDADSEFGDMLKKYGRRNIALLTIAPTGSVSILSQTTSGIEPAFMIAYKRRKKINPNDKSAKISFVDKNGDSWEEYSVSHPKFTVWLKVNGYDVDATLALPEDELNKIIEKSPYYGATSNDVDWVEKVRMQGEMQKWVDHSISVTVNLPENTSEEIVNKIYLTAWESGCKGITIYRDGSRSGVLVTDKDKKEQEKEIIFSDKDAPRRPKRLKGEIVRFQNNLEKWIAVVGLYDGRPYEIFTGRLENGLSKLPVSVKECEIVKNKDENGASRYDIEYLDENGAKQISTGLSHKFDPQYWNYAKLISGLLRHQMPIVYVYHTISKLNLNDDNLNTWKAGLMRVIKKYIKDGVSIKGECPECHSTELVYKEGCLSCASCGYSKCS